MPPADQRLKISTACPLILPCHVALDLAREKARGAKAIGTTGRGIGPAYEDKVARRAIRFGDLSDPDQLAAKLKELLDYHNFMLERYFQAQPIDFQRVLEETLAMAEAIIRHTAAGQLGPRGVMSCLQETVVGVPPLDQGLHGRSEPQIWYWIWRDERAERPWTVAPGRWSPSVISPARGSAASSGQVVIH